MTDDIFLRSEVYEKLKSYTISSVPQKIKNIMELLKLEAMAEDFPPQPDRIHVANGTLMLDGGFVEGKTEIVQSRLSVSYNPNAPACALAALSGWVAVPGGYSYIAGVHRLLSDSLQ